MFTRLYSQDVPEGGNVPWCIIIQDAISSARRALVTEGVSSPIPMIQGAKHSGSLRYSYHALRQGLSRGISLARIEAALDSSQVRVLEDYQDDQRSPSCLVVGWDDDLRPLHVVVAYGAMRVITVYEPSLPKWGSPIERVG
ncbi:MAG: DUF4258 domain-containing protein [Chloroflexi bacterium]|nr:DUF4258 domain-containing protein [Chloroflexota bacterium]